MFEEAIRNSASRVAPPAGSADSLLQLPKHRGGALASSMNFRVNQVFQFSLFGRRQRGTAIAGKTPPPHQVLKPRSLFVCEELVWPLVLHDDQSGGFFALQGRGQRVQSFACSLANGLPPASNSPVAYLA
jgi:hypothetical protein